MEVTDTRDRSDFSDLSVLSDIVGSFAIPGHLLSAERLTTGHINDSWRVAVDGGGGREYILQRLNSKVFTRPDLVMQNVARISARLNRQEAAVTGGAIRVPELIPTRSGAGWHVDAENGHWRLMPFVAGTITYDRVTHTREAREVGRAFGEFQRLLADWDAPWLHETIAGFHDTVARFAAFDQAVSVSSASLRSEARPEIDRILAHRDLASRILELQSAGVLPERVAHNDAKIGNVLFDERTGRAAWIIDLDTAMPGTLLHDFGDLVRSCTSATGEDERDLSLVEVRLPLFETLAGGYLAAAGEVMTREEIDNLVLAGRIITLEQAVRFLTDFLTGDQYYRTTRPGQNLDRARTQLRLFDSLTEQETELDAIIARLAGGPST